MMTQEEMNNLYDLMTKAAKESQLDIFSKERREVFEPNIILMCKGKDAAGVNVEYIQINID